MKKYLIVLMLLVPSLSLANFDASLKYGAKGDTVRELQEFLIDQGDLNAQASGNFYSLTLKAVKKFQIENNLPSTGYWGMLSRTKAKELTNLSLSDQDETSDTGSVNIASIQIPNVSDPLVQNKLDAINTQIATLNALQQQQTLLQQQIATNTDSIKQNTNTPPIYHTGPYPDIPKPHVPSSQPTTYFTLDGSKVTLSDPSKYNDQTFLQVIGAEYYNDFTGIMRPLGNLKDNVTLELTLDGTVYSATPFGMRDTPSFLIPDFTGCKAYNFKVSYIEPTYQDTITNETAYNGCRP